MKTLFIVNIKLKYYYNLVREKSSFKNINKSINSLTLKLININIIVFIEIVELNKRNSVTRRDSFSSIDTIAS